MDVVERDITLTCVSNEVGGNLVGAARWLGVPLRDVLDRAGIGRPRPTRSSAPPSTGSRSARRSQVALDGRNSLVAFGMNGEPLPREHGFPVRLVTPGLYGYVGSTKWLEKLTLTTYDEQEAYWTKRKWAIDGPIKLSSRVDTPARSRPSTPARPSSAASPGPSPTAWRRSRSGSTGATGRRRSSAPAAAWSTGASGTCPGTPTSGSHQIAVRATNQRRRDPDPRPRRPRSPTARRGIQEVVVTVA